jgi:hypothetical protein
MDGSLIGGQFSKATKPAEIVPALTKAKRKEALKLARFIHHVPA